MPLALAALAFDAQDPSAVARFWSGVLGWDVDPVATVPTLVPDDDTGFQLVFLHSPTPKTGPNQMHFDLTSESPEAQQETVARALSLGGRHIDVGQLPEEEHVVLADPEGNEFCVIEAGNTFLADCGFIGAVSSDGTRDVGLFWSAALEWPLVWDQGEETAIRSPHGGPKITWGGPPLQPKTGRNRLHLDLVPAGGSDVASEVDRLESLGARRTGASRHVTGGVELTDPDGNELCVLPG